MPELPEVETVRRGLAPVLEGARLTEVILNRPDLRVPFGADFVPRLVGARIHGVHRRGKYLLFSLEKAGKTFWMIGHLGMSGRFVIENGARKGSPGQFLHDHNRLTRHDHALFFTDGGMRVTYNDPRRFGFMYLFEDPSTHPSIANMGPEPLDARFDGKLLRAALQNRRTPIKTALLDQRVVSGLGNIYVCEALHQAQISPQHLAHALSLREADALVSAIRETLEAAIRAGGSTLRDHAQVDGTLGYFQHSFKVYDREGEPCARATCRGVVERLVQAGRSTFFCPLCQSQNAGLA
jgi:formamidopyrimidine-DNA glycosylase